LPTPGAWAITNTLAIGFLVLLRLLAGDRGWSDLKLGLLTFGVALTRTIIDYTLSFKSYFPVE